MMRIFTSTLALSVFCIAGQVSEASAAETDGGLLERYTGMMNQLRTELTATNRTGPGSGDAKCSGTTAPTTFSPPTMVVATRESSGATSSTGGGRVRQDRPELQNYQDILKFSRTNAPRCGVAVKALTLAPRG